MIFFVLHPTLLSYNYHPYRNNIAVFGFVDTSREIFVLSIISLSILKYMYMKHR